MTEDDIDTATALRRLQRVIDDLHRRAGRPSQREVMEKTDLSHATVAKILNGEFGRWDSTEQVIAALGGDPEDFRDLWQLGKGVPVPKRVYVSQRQLIEEVLVEIRELRKEVAAMRTN